MISRRLSPRKVFFIITIACVLLLSSFFITPVFANYIINDSIEWANTAYNQTREQQATGYNILEWIPQDALSHWTFDEGFGTISHDENVTNLNDGTINIGYDFYSQTNQGIILDETQHSGTTAPHTAHITRPNPLGTWSGHTYWIYVGEQISGNIDLFFAENLTNSSDWTAYASNPIITGNEARWPTVLYEDGIFWMVHTVEYESGAYLVMKNSTDGINFTFYDNVTDDFTAVNGRGYFNSFLLRGQDNNFHLTCQYDDGSVEQVQIRTATTIPGLVSASNTTIGDTATGIWSKAPSMFYRDNLYWLLTEGNTANWNIYAYANTEPDSAYFAESPNSPILTDDTACPFPYVENDILYDCLCYRNATGIWKLTMQTSNLSESLSGGGWTTDTKQGDYAVSLNGVNESISIADNVSLNITSVITVSAWAYLDSSFSDGWPKLITKGNPEAYQIYYDTFFDGYAAGVTVGSTSYSAVSSDTTKDVWKHFVLTYDGETVEFFIDGICVATNTDPSGDIDTNNADIVIGNRLTDERHWKGKIDDVRIYNRVLSQAEINQTRDNYHETTGNVTHWHNAGSGYQTASFIVNMTTPTNMNYTVWYADNGSSFSQIGGVYTGNQTPSISGSKYQNTDLRIIMNGNTTATPEEIEITFVTEAAVAEPIITLLSQTPSIIYKNSTGYLNISYGISHDSSGLNNTSVSFIYRNYDWDLSDSNHSIRPPANDLASIWNFNGRILRGANRNETPGLNFENNDTITGGDTYTWSGLDENSTKLTIVPVNSTYSLVYINATVHCIMPQMWYLDRTDQQEATKTQLPIHKTSNVLIKFWNFEIFKGNYDFLGVGYTDTSLNSNPALWPSDANPVNFYYVNSSYDPATGGDPITSGYAVYMGSLNASGWVDYVYSRSNSNYVRGFIDNNYLHTVINTTNLSYLYFTSNTESSKPFYINMTNGATSTNRTFANTDTLWAGGSHPLTAQSYTPNVWFAFMKLNMSLDHRLYAADNNDLWGSSTMNRTNITQALFPPTTPTIDHFHFPTANDTDYDMDGVYYGNFSIGCGVSSDPDGGDVTHNLTLHYANNLTLVTIINNTFTDKDITHNGVYFDANFSSIPYYSQTENYTLRLIATDDESETVTVWLNKNFSLDGSPRIITYSPETPVSSAEGENQTFSITTNLLGNVIWYLDSVEVFNETDVNSSSYSNSTALAGTYNVTVVTTNTNGTNSMTWEWIIITLDYIPLSIFMFMGLLLCVFVGASFYLTGIFSIFTSILSVMFAFILSKISINGTLTQNVGGIDSSGNVVQGVTIIEIPALAYILLFVGVVMVVILAIQVLREIKFRETKDVIELDI